MAALGRLWLEMTHEVGWTGRQANNETAEATTDETAEGGHPTNSNHDHALQRFAQGLAEDGGGGAGSRFVFAEVDDDDLVLALVHLLFEFGLQADSVDRFEDAEEDRVLPRLAVALADFVNVTQSLRIADVVADEVAVAHGIFDL